MIIFDNGGVFVTTSSSIFLLSFKKFTGASLSELRKAYWYLSKPLDTGKEAEINFYRKFTKKIKFNCSIKELLKIRYSKIKRIPGTGGILRKVIKKYKVAMMNNEYKECMKFLLKKYPYFKYFKKRVTSCEVGFRKPESQIYKIMLKKLGVKPEECLFIDDLKDNTKTARKLGINTITFRNAKQLKDNLKKFGIFV
ncbi:MAG: HAD family phosphatase [Nanoarchaeota archaeon]